MKRVLALALALLPAAATAHPSWGVVVDGDGCVFHSDLSRVFRRAADGSESRSPAVHAHALALSPDGTVVGEESQYVGADRFRHRTWEWGHGAIRFGRWQPGIGPSQGIHRRRDGSSVRESCESDPCRIVEDLGNRSTVLHEAPPGSRIRALHVTPAGRVVFVQDDRVLELEGEVARAISDARPNRFGVYADDCGHVLATSHGDGVVELLRDGRAEVVYTSTPPWAPTGVAVADPGLWVLEFSRDNDARLVHADVEVPTCDHTER